jgi:hypothetical protein
MRRARSNSEPFFFFFSFSFSKLRAAALPEKPQNEGPIACRRLKRLFRRQESDQSDWRIFSHWYRSLFFVTLFYTETRKKGLGFGGSGFWD